MNLVGLVAGLFTFSHQLLSYLQPLPELLSCRPNFLTLRKYIQGSLFIINGFDPFLKSGQKQHSNIGLDPAGFQPLLRATQKNGKLSLSLSFSLSNSLPPSFPLYHVLVLNPFFSGKRETMEYKLIYNPFSTKKHQLLYSENYAYKSFVFY